MPIFSLNIIFKNICLMKSVFKMFEKCESRVSVYTPSLALWRQFWWDAVGSDGELQSRDNVFQNWLSDWHPRINVPSFTVILNEICCKWFGHQCDSKKHCWYVPLKFVLKQLCDIFIHTLYSINGFPSIAFFSLTYICQQCVFTSVKVVNSFVYEVKCNTSKPLQIELPCMSHWTLCDRKFIEMPVITWLISSQCCFLWHPGPLSDMAPKNWLWLVPRWGVLSKDHCNKLWYFLIKKLTRVETSKKWQQWGGFPEFCPGNYHKLNSYNSSEESLLITQNS